MYLITAIAAAAAAAATRCAWGGTPVSFTRSRICSQDGKQYNILNKSNYQGPPGSNECRCKTPTSTPAPVPPASVKITVDLKAKTGKDIKGSDIACDGQKYCKVCRGVSAITAACASRPRCVAFVFEQGSDCGYLKTAAEPLVDRQGWVVYSRL